MPIRDFPAPRSQSWERGARAWLAAPGEGPTVRGAATVLLVRDGDSGPEVFVLRRVATMEFAPRMHVFPGGGVDPVDAAWAPDAADEGSSWALVRLAGRMGLPVEAAAPLVACALREVEEEVGVVLTVDDLRARANWVTPPFEPRRYDTWFFAARLPADQAAEAVTTESDHARWVRPADLLAEHAAGTAMMLPPTLVMLEEVAAAGDCAAYLAGEPVIAMVSPELVDLGDRLVMRAHLPD